MSLACGDTSDGDAIDRSNGDFVALNLNSPHDLAVANTFEISSDHDEANLGLGETQ
jgi:hypothetical protein